MELQENINLKDFSCYKIGGPARYFADAKNIGDFKDAIRKGKELGVPIFILGGGSNILWGDDGYDGLVIRPSLDFIKTNGTKLTAGAGVPMENLVDFAVSHGLAGLEWAGGLPGSFGGAVFGNAGAFGGEIKDVVEKVVSINAETLEVITRPNKKCGFGYRMSAFKENSGKEVILEATLKLKKGDGKALAKSVQEKIDYRRKRHPIEYPNIGSIFENIKVEGLPEGLVEPHRGAIKTDPFPVIPAAHLIHEAGLSGEKRGGAQISPKHPNFIVNTDGASAKDVLELITLVKERVKEKFGIELEPEVRILA